MRKLLLIACALALTGCAWLGFGDDAETTASETSADQVAAPETMATDPAVQVEQKAPAPAKKEAAKKQAKPVKGVKTEAQIKADLEATGKKLAAQAARTLLPNRTRPEYKQVGGQWVASYIDVDPTSVTTELRNSSSGAGYVGYIRYKERFMECKGATKEAALSGSCVTVKTSNRTELIRHDGKEWQD